MEIAEGYILKVHFSKQYQRSSTVHISFQVGQLCLVDETCITDSIVPDAISVGFLHKVFCTD